MLRSVIRGLIASVVVLGLGSCALYQPLPFVRQREVNLDDTVLVIRSSTQLTNPSGNKPHGEIILVQADGSVKLMDVGAMDVGKVVWGEDKVFFSGPEDEYTLTPDGLEKYPRGTLEEYEQGRFLKQDRENYVAIYNVGFGEEGEAYSHYVTTGNPQEPTSWTSEGLFSSLHQCGDTIVGITDIIETSFVERPAFDEAREDYTEVLVQLYPKPSNAQDSILGTETVSGVYAQATFDAPCTDDVAYVFSIYDEDPGNDKDGIPVLRSWDITTGKHHAVPLVFSNSEPADIFSDYDAAAGGVVGDTYLWSTTSGRVFSTNVKTGETTFKFAFDLYAPDGGESQIMITDQGLLVLNASGGEQDLQLDLYDLDTGVSRRLMTIPNPSARVWTLRNSIIRDMAYDPNWLQQQ